MRLLAAALLLGAIAHAEGEPLLFLSHVEHVEELSDPAYGKAFALLGRLTIENGRLFSVRASRALIWLDPDADRMVFRLLREMQGEDRRIPLWAVRAVYAEGGGVPAVFQAGGQAFRCASFFYDFRGQRGIFVDADLRLRRGPRRDDSPDLVLRAKELELLGNGSLVARKGTLFASNFEDFDVGITVEELRVDDPEMGGAIGKLKRLSARDYGDGRGPTRAEVEAVIREMAEAGTVGPEVYTLHGLVVRAYDFPIFKWGEAQARGEDVMAVRLESELGSIGNLGFGARLAAGLGLKPVGFLLGGGYIDDHGPFVDLKLDVDAWGGRVTGRSYGAYLHDHGIEDGVAPETENRFWTQNFYRWRVNDTWRLDAEYADLSDPTFLEQWDEQVAKEGLPQETLVYLRGRTERAYATMITKWRTIDFQDEVERLPEIGGVVPVLTLLRLGETGRGDPVTLQVALPASFGNLRHRQGEGSTLPDFQSVRATFDPTFYVSFPLGPLRVVPFVTPGVTVYEHDLAGDAATRTTASAGIRADTQLSRWFGRVHHVVNLSLAYEDLFHVSVPPDDLFPFDELDEVTPWQGLTVRWRNRLLRSTPFGATEFLSVELFGAFYPNGEQPLGRTGDWWLDWNVWWQATRTLIVLSRGDIEEGDLETLSFEWWWEARANLGFGASYRHLEGDSDTITLGAEFEVNTRWSLVGFSQFDARAGEASDQGVLIRRLGRSGVVGVRLTWDPGDDGFGLSLNFDVLQRFREKERRRDTLRALVGWN
ncbi:MAG TPA: hypothetical protein VFY93_03665 [Planctomycetota bacterium]|nr:hypothetical protein [Planctomycetota bacterium]